METLRLESEAYVRGIKKLSTNQLKKSVIYHNEQQEEGSCEFVELGTLELQTRLSDTDYEQFICELTGMSTEDMIQEANDAM